MKTMVEVGLHLISVHYNVVLAGSTGSGVEVGCAVITGGRLSLFAPSDQPQDIGFSNESSIET